MSVFRTPDWNSPATGLAVLQSTLERFEMEGTLVVLAILLSADSATGMNDFCRNHTVDRPTNSEDLHFSKENSDREYGIKDKFKCLHCCTHGYRSIEWFKEGQAYPWPTDVSTLITHPQSGNQTICSQQSTPIDSGRYWCVARNETHSLRHEVLLQISGPSISMGWPKTTYRPRDQKADHGDFVRFYCEAFVGTIDLPDFQSEIAWERYDLNESFINGERVREETIFREEKRILGSYLTFREVAHEDYGEYTCKVRNLGDQVVRLSAWLRKRRRETAEYLGGTFKIRRSYLLMALLVLTAALSTVTLLHFGYYLRVIRNRIFQASPRLDGTRKTLLVVYLREDEKEASKTVPGLLQHSYSLHPLRSKTQLGDEDLKAKANSYRAVVALVSPSLVQGGWSCRGIHQVVETLLKVHFTIICVFTQELPRREDDEGWCLLQDSLSKVHYLEKGRGKDVNFWAKLPFWSKHSASTGSSQSLI